MPENRKNLPIQLLVGGLLIALCWVIFDGMRERIVEVGDTAPSFKIVTDRGKTLTRSEFGGKVLVLNFWATWCPPCIEEIPSLDAMQRQLSSEGVVVLAVSVDKNEAAYREFLRGARVSFETSRDPSADISASYGTFKYPETYVIDRNGKVVSKYVSNRDWTSEEILRDIRRLL